MTKYSKELVSVPGPRLGESPSSWLSRAAPRQAVSVDELLGYFGLPIKGDTDLNFVRGNVQRVTGLTGLHSKQFDLVQKMFLGAAKLAAGKKSYLLSHDGMPRYRFCACCLERQSEKFFPLHWRFKAWRWCPDHFCLLDDVCPHCAAPVILPAMMLKAGPKKEGVGSLGRCMSCSKKLFTEYRQKNGSLNFRYLNAWEAALLKNGRALLAALYQGDVYIQDQPQRLPLSAIARLEKQRLLPHDSFFLTTADLERRSGTFRVQPPNPISDSEGSKQKPASATSL